MAHPKFEDYKAPWEVDKDGKDIPVEDQKPTPEQLKKHIWNVLGDKDKAQTARDTALGQVTELTSKVTELEKSVNDKAAEKLSDVEKLTKSVEALTTRAEQAEFEVLKTGVIATHKIKPEAADLLLGKTKAELEASALRLVGLGLVIETTDEGKNQQVDEGGNPLETKPRQRHNAGDPLDDGDSGKDVTPADFVKSFEAGSFSL